MADINQQMKHGIFWTAINNYSSQIIALFISMILARLLTPQEFGIVATASVLLVFLNIFTTMGIGPAIIQRKDLTQDDLNNIFSFSVYLGLLTGGISFASSWIIADFYANPQLCPVVQILSCGLFFTSINMVPQGLMSKNLRFKEMAKRNLTFQILFGIVGVISAFQGAGVYALICPQICSSLCTFFYNNHFYPVKFKLKFSIEPVKRIASYTNYVFLTNFFYYFSGNLDKLIIGKSISSEALGYYEKSYRLMQMPMDNINSVINPVLQPVLSSLQDNLEEMARKYVQIVSVIATIGFPIAVVMYFNAHEIIFVLFGDRWEFAVPAFKILTISIPFILLCKPNGPMCLACNASKQMFVIGMSNSTMTIAAIAVGGFCFGTIEAIAWARVAVCLLIFANCFYSLFVSIMKVSLIPVIRILVKPVLSAIMLTFVYLLYSVLIPEFSSEVINLILKLIVGGLSFCLYFYIWGDKRIISVLMRK